MHKYNIRHNPQKYNVAYTLETYIVHKSTNTIVAT